MVKKPGNLRIFPAFAFIVIIEETVSFLIFMITDDGTQIDILYTVENIGFNKWADLAELGDEFFHFIAFGAPAAAAGSTVFRETAGTLDKMKIVGISPGLDICFFYQVKGADQFHTFKVLAVKLWHHGLNFGTIEHSHKDGLDDIIKMVAESDLVAAEFFCMGIKVATAHSRTEIAGVFINLGYHIENFRFENGERDSEDPGIVLDDLPVVGVITGVHYQKD